MGERLPIFLWCSVGYGLGRKWLRRKHGRGILLRMGGVQVGKECVERGYGLGEISLPHKFDVFYILYTKFRKSLLQFSFGIGGEGIGERKILLFKVGIIYFTKMLPTYN